VSWFEKWQKAFGEREKAAAEPPSPIQKEEWGQRWLAGYHYRQAPPEDQEALRKEFPDLFEYLIYSAPPAIQEEPAEAKDNRQWWQKSLGWITDRAGNVWGTGLEALAVPADFVERVMNYPLTYIWTNDVPDGYSRWDLAALGFDINTSYLTGGPEMPGKKVAILNREMAKGTPWEDIKDQVADPWLDLPHKILADPLWLIGGAGILAKAPGGIARRLPVVGKFVEKVLPVKGMGEAATASQTVSAVKNQITLARHIAGFTEGRHGLKALATLESQLPKLEKAAAQAKLGLVGRLIEYGLIGGGEAPINLFKSAKYSNLTKLPIAGTPLRVFRAILGPRPADQAMAQAMARTMGTASARAQVIATGNPRFPGLGLLARLFKVTPRFQAVQTGMDLDTLLTRLTDEATGLTQEQLALFIDAMHQGPGGIQALPTEILSRVPTEYLRSELGVKLQEITQAIDFSSSMFPSLAKEFPDHTTFRSTLFEEMSRKVSPQILKSFGVEGPMDATQGMLGMYKAVLSVTTLNTPSFVVLNAMNNLATVFADYGVDTFRGGFWMPAIKRHLVDAGASVDEIDRAMQPGIREMFGVGPEEFRRGWRKWAFAFVNASGNIDAWARLKSWQIGRQRGMASTLRNILPNPRSYHLYPESVQGMVAGARKSLESGDNTIIARLREDILRGRTPAAGHLYGIEWARDVKWSGVDERMLDLSMEHMDDIFYEVDSVAHWATSEDDVIKGIERLKNRITYHTESVRAANKLQALGEITPVSGAGATSARIGIALDKRGKYEMQLLGRFLPAHDVPESVTAELLTPLRDAFKKSYDERVYLDALIHADESMVARGLVLPDEWARLQRDGPNALWQEYFARRLARFEEVYDNLIGTLSKERPEIVPNIERVRDSHLGILHQEDTMRGLAFAKKDPWKLVEGVPIGDLRREFDRMANEATTSLEQTLGMKYIDDVGYPAADNLPSVAEGITMSNTHALEYLEWVEPKLLADFYQPRLVPPEFVDEMVRWVDDLPGIYNDASMVATRVGHAMADWTMLNYRAIGNADTWLMWVMPYHFWPVRSMWRWSQRFLANPGLASILAKTKDLQNELTKDMPRRMEGQFPMIPVPFLGDLMDKQFGMGMGMFFDPLQIMFPVLQWSEDFSYETRQNTTFGRVLDWWGNNGPGVSPFIPLIGAHTGLLDRQEWLTRNWPRSLPFGIPGTPSQMAILAWLEGDDRVPINRFLSEDEQALLLKGAGLPLHAIQRTLGLDDDEWDTYRIDRALSDLVSERVSNISDPEERQAIVEEYLRAMDDPDHPLWKEARNFASKEYGIQALTSWLGFRISLYPDGEDKARSLQPIFSRYRDAERLDEFFERFPEYRIRQIALRGFESREERDKALHRSLFSLDMTRAQAVLEEDRAEWQGIQRELQSDPKFYQTKTGRWYRDMIDEEYGTRIREDTQAINRIYAMYEGALDSPSYQRTPVERGLILLANDYYDIDLQDFLPSGKTIDTATDAEILTATERMWDAREEFVNKLPSRRSSAVDWTKHNIRYYAAYLVARRESSELAAQDKYDETDAVWEKARGIQDEATELAKGMITRSEFQGWLTRNREPPSELQVAFEQAQEEMSTYMAMGDLLNWPRDVRREYWEGHPLLEFFYGNEPDPYEGGWPPEMLEVYARLMQIRDSYYKKPSIRRLDYLSTVLDELNILLDILDLPMVELEQVRPGRWDLRLPGIGLPPLEEVEERL